MDMRLPPNLKIGIVSHEYPPYTFGGVANHVKGLAQALSRKNVQVRVICGGSKSLVEEKVNDCLEVVRLSILNIPPRTVWFQLQNFRYILEALRDCDVIHGMSGSSAICAYAKRKLGKPWLVSFHGVPHRNLSVFFKAPFYEWTPGDIGLHVFEYPLWDFLNRIEVHLSDHGVAVGKCTLQDLKAVYKIKNWSVIPNGIDFEELNKHAVEDCRVNDSGKFRIAFIGRLYWRKGILHLVRAIRLLAKERRDFCLHVFGRGPLASKIRHWVQKSSLTSYIRLRGWVPRSELIEEVMASDVVALPSLYEVGPFVVALEAMALGKPVIAYDYPFTREFLMHMQTAFLVKAESVEGLMRAIRTLYGDQNLREYLGQNALQHVRANHDWKKLANSYLEIYTGLLDKQEDRTGVGGVAEQNNIWNCGRRNFTRGYGIKQ